MINPKCKLVVVPEGWAAVPEEPTIEQLCAAAMLRSSRSRMFKNSEMYRALIDSAPHLPDTQPVLRWDGNALYLFSDYVVTWVANDGDDSGWYYMPETGAGVGVYSTAEEARRAAEKALGFPDWLVIDAL